MKQEITLREASDLTPMANGIFWFGVFSLVCTILVFTEPGDIPLIDRLFGLGVSILFIKMGRSMKANPLLPKVVLSPTPRELRITKGRNTEVHSYDDISKLVLIRPKPGNRTWGLCFHLPEEKKLSIGAWLDRNKANEMAETITKELGLEVEEEERQPMFNYRKQS